MSVSLLFMLVSAAVCLFLPTVVALIYIKKTSASWKAFLLGAIVFTVSQLLTRIPLLGLLQGTAWFQIFTMTNTVVYIFLLALSAGIFEELGRYFGIKLSLKKDMLTWQNGFAFGLGHGGIEAFLLAGLPLVNIIINTISGQNSTAVMSPPADFLLGGVERIIAVALHIGLTMLVLYAVRHKKTVYLIFAIAAHMLVDAVFLLLTQLGFTMGYWITEGMLAVMAALVMFWAIKLKPRLMGTTIEKGEEEI